MTLWQTKVQLIHWLIHIEDSAYQRDATSIDNHFFQQFAEGEPWMLAGIQHFTLNLVHQVRENLQSPSTATLIGKS